MNTCPNCNHENSYTANFCENCGHKLGTIDEEEKIDHETFEKEVVEIIRTVFDVMQKLSEVRRVKSFSQAGKIIDEAIETMKECGPLWHKTLFAMGKKYCTKCGRSTGQEKGW